MDDMGDGGGGHWLVRMEWRPAGWSVCLPLLISPCAIKSRSSLLAAAHPGGPRKRAVKRLWCGGVVWTIREVKSRNKRSNTKSVELNKNILHILAVSVFALHVRNVGVQRY